MYVVEPGKYEPETHSNIFEAAINVFIERRIQPLDRYASDTLADPPLRFDLVTFPEAFLPAERLIDLLAYISRAEGFGCVHVGLRPSATDLNHLFAVPELSNLVKELRGLPDIVNKDLDSFECWLSGQTLSARFNVGCLFAVDADRRVRICLHPKMVQSKYEVSPLPEDNMEEANLLTVVTLRPTNKDLKTVVVQPLLCSDALHLGTKRNGSRPLEALQKDAGCLGNQPPDHIDIVSVATCTPQVPGLSSRGANYRTWHSEFRDTFRRAANDDALGRHHFAAFVLSNFQIMPTGGQGGLSGAFMPVSVRHREFPEFVTLCSYGRPGGAFENRWSGPDDDYMMDGKSRGHIVALSPFTGRPEAAARIFGFTVHRLPRDQSLWSPNEGLTHCTLKIGEVQESSQSLQFVS
ncbi:hypothetical protein U7859_02295 [Bradyrhizobium ottawaense]|uniref:hypothetical protein n=1 Tax=Bradyrhizobium ottawaense TaxID=931866 RepID=UPI002ADF6EFB|nr:hypothetical protein [Bradyrhizobium ottawaense]WQN83334.1 hypothetical protein U7859_02295 [Bradyrhizobium ottawaense]